MQTARRPRVTIKTALVAGFGLTLGLWTFTGYHVIREMRHAHEQAAHISERFQHAQELLTSVRMDVLQASVLVSDALLGTGRAAVIERLGIADVYAGIDATLDAYVPVSASEDERERVAWMRTQIHDFRDASLEVLAPSPELSTGETRLVLRRLMPKRESIIRLTDEIQSLNRTAFVDAQRAAAAMSGGAQTQIWSVFGTALLTSLAIAWGAARHAVRLEHRLTEQRAREERIATDLQRLSARLVAAQEDEQRRIARELHDEVGQALSTVSVELSVARRRLDRIGSDSTLLSDAQASAESALRSVRDLSHLLHPTALDDLGLVAALDSHVAEFRRRHRIDVDFRATGLDRRQPAEVERAVYRIVQEALTNMARHAHATGGEVRLESADGRLTVTVDDNGIGFDSGDVERPGGRQGLGLLGMRERAAQLRGSITVGPSPDGGTRVRAEFPVAARRPPARADAAPERPIQHDLTEVTHG